MNAAVNAVMLRKLDNFDLLENQTHAAKNWRVDDKLDR